MSFGSRYYRQMWRMRRQQGPRGQEYRSSFLEERLFKGCSKLKEQGNTMNELVLFVNC